MNNKKLQEKIQAIYRIVEELEKTYKRKFTPDGHMVGSIGECLVADAYGLELMPHSNKGFDALTKDGKKVEIKATQGERVLFRDCPKDDCPHVIIIKIEKDGTFKECYNGSGEAIWKEFKDRSNGQYSISLVKVKKLQKDEERLLPKYPLPQY